MAGSPAEATCPRNHGQRYVKPPAAAVTFYRRIAHLSADTLPSLAVARLAGAGVEYTEKEARFGSWEVVLTTMCCMF
jgi:hypothetical protein